MTNPEEYVVGPGKPPRGTRFKKGQIANPNGRRGKTKDSEIDLGKILQFVDNEKILVTIDGKRTRKTKAEINYIQLFTQALRGKLSAARLIADLAATCFAPEAQSDQQYIFHVMSEEAFEYYREKAAKKGKIKKKHFAPIRSIYPPGFSQNPELVSVVGLFRKVAYETIPIEINGRIEKIPRWNAYIVQLYNMALNKNHGATRLITKLRKQFPGDPLPGNPHVMWINESDAAL